MNREIDLSETCYGRVRDLQYDLAVLPWGATEPHNLHLPYLTDCILAHDIAVDAARKALETCGVCCMVLPPVSMGSQNPGQRELPFCIHARYETQKAILTDIASSLRAQGMRRLVIVNGHGGNCFKNMIRDLAVEMPDLLIAAGDWYAACPAQDFFDEPGDHADELETDDALSSRAGEPRRGGTGDFETFCSAHAERKGGLGAPRLAAGVAGYGHRRSGECHGREGPPLRRSRRRPFRGVVLRTGPRPGLPGLTARVAGV